MTPIEQIGLSSGIFTAIILFLVCIILIVEKFLVQSGPVTLSINGDPNLNKTISAGGTLLSALAGTQIILPSACGGGGTCAMCKCVVKSGGGDILPTETGHLNRTEQKNGVRLACQVKVRGDMDIEIPNEIFNIKEFKCKVRSNDNVATFIKELVLEIQDGDILNFQAGGYIQINIPEYHGIKYQDYQIQEKYHEDWDKHKVWGLVANNPEPIFRAYSMANHPAEGNIVMLNVRIATPPWDRAKNGWMDVNPGISSSYIFNLKKGDECSVSGPFGEFFIQKTKREMVYIGGGAGMAPLRSHIFHLFHTEKSDRKVSYWYGARSKREIFYEEHFLDIEKKFPNFKFNIALSEPLPEDNWTGYKGFIHNVVLNEYLSKHPEPENVEYYLCGPPMMNSAVFKMLADLGVEKDMIRFDDFGG